MKFGVLVCLALLATPACVGQRKTIDLDGTWEIDDSVAATEQPAHFGHTAPVPGLAHSATPAFADVDQFDSREHIANLVRDGALPHSSLVNTAGVSRQARNYFWYRRNFQIAAMPRVAILQVNKAQFGMAVRVNGTYIGEHLPCFSAAFFNVTAALRSGKNEVLIRVGAHPGVLPDNVSAGSDFEKVRWTPGIYDDVSLRLSGDAVIETVQVAPRITPTAITVQTKVRNYGAAAVEFDLSGSVHAWKESGVIARAKRHVRLAAGEEETITQQMPLPGARLWSPESPNLYVLESSSGGDSASTRFGVREFHFDTATRRAYLNGRPIFLRGSNITLHRFFEDPLSGTLPWDNAWVRKALITIPKQMHWNAFRFCIGPVPQHWLDVADEAGLLIQNEYFVWVGGGWFGKDYPVHLDSDELISEMKEWVRDNWNHPSVAFWDADNESTFPEFTTKIIPAVRSIDLSKRDWENSYNAPAGPDDPVEDHPYFFINLHDHEGNWQHPFSMAELQGRNDSPNRVAAPTGHTEIINEYGWLWLNRDGSPTKLTYDVYPKLLGDKDTAAERVKWDAYLLAGLTEFWRAYRHYAGVDHFVYLTGCNPDGYTCDNFRDVRKLELQPEFADYVGNAFAPLGVYINFWEPKLAAGSKRTFTVMLVNDEYRDAAGTLSLVLEDGAGQQLAAKDQKFQVAALGQTTMLVDFDVPQGSGKCTLKAIAKAAGGSEAATVSRRWVDLVQAP